MSISSFSGGSILTSVRWGNAVAWIVSPFLWVINPDNTWQTVAPPLWAGNAQRCARATIFANSTPPPLTQRNVAPSLCAGNVQHCVSIATAKRAFPWHKEGALPSAMPWGCHCKEHLTFFRWRDPDSTQWICFFLYNYLFILLNYLFLFTPIQSLKNPVTSFDALPHLRLYLFPS